MGAFWAALTVPGSQLATALSEEGTGSSGSASWLAEAIAAGTNVEDDGRAAAALALWRLHGAAAARLAMACGRQGPAMPDLRKNIVKKPQKSYEICFVLKKNKKY
ncbi:unnamed protein product [Polarella glacialis]|uniref:Uncharacterized protein n=1 Tax=Polarella glacialis TaxID=89957 RepID=A0A813IE28_POLGL|nr:unnamed protein product [Polarella glacialis]